MRNRFNYSGFPDISRPQWAGRELNPSDMLPGGAKVDDTAFSAYTTAVTVVTSAAAAIAATSLAVTALSSGIPAGTQLNFGLPTVQAFVIAAAAAGAVLLEVAPLVTAVPSGATATFRGQYGIMVPSGTLVSRTYAQRAAGGLFHPAVAAEDEYFLTAFDVRDATLDNDVSLVLRDGHFPIKENFLPNYFTIANTSALLTILRAGYACTLGV